MIRLWRNRIVRGGDRPVGGVDLSERGDPAEVHRWHLLTVAETERMARQVYRLEPRSHAEQMAKVAELDAAWEAKRMDRRGGRDRRRDVRRHVV